MGDPVREAGADKEQDRGASAGARSLSVVERLRAWIEDGEGGVRARTWVPPYPNPTALRTDLRLLLAAVAASDRFLEDYREGREDLTGSANILGDALAALYSHATATAVATEVSKASDPPTTEPATEED